MKPIYPNKEARASKSVFRLVESRLLAALGEPDHRELTAIVEYRRNDPARRTVVRCARPGEAPDRHSIIFVARNHENGRVFWGYSGASKQVWRMAKVDQGDERCTSLWGAAIESGDIVFCGAEPSINPSRDRPTGGGHLHAGGKKGSRQNG